MFSPDLFDTSSITALCPLFLANPCLILNESTILAKSPSLTEDFSFDFIGNFKRSSISLNNPGTRILKLPVSFVNVPAGIRILACFIDSKTSLAVNP